MRRTSSPANWRTRRFCAASTTRFTWTRCPRMPSTRSSGAWPARGWSPVTPESFAAFRDLCLADGRSELRACYPNDICKILNSIARYESREAEATPQDLERARAAVSSRRNRKATPRPPVVGQFELEARPRLSADQTPNVELLSKSAISSGVGAWNISTHRNNCIPFYGRILHAPALNPVEENIHWRREIVQLNSSAKGSGSEPQCIPLGSSPSAPFDDYGKTVREEFLTELPLQSLDLPRLPSS